jgi:tRNA(adenine34) deaminase
MTHKKFNSFDEMAMDLAIQEAEKAFLADEVPVGAVLTLENKIISTGYNRVHELKDSSMHAEMICLKKGAKILGDFRLVNCILYTTLEPCAMCAGAIINFRIKKVIWGAKDLRVGASGTLYNLFDGRHPIHKVEFESGLMEEKSANLLKMFFKNKRVKNEKFI